MKLGEISELHLAAIVAGATLVGGLLTTLLGAFLIDAGTDKQTDVQLVELAIGILSEPLSENATDQNALSDTALRDWAVNTINATAPVRFSSAARNLLVTGKIQLFRETIIIDGTEIEASPEVLRSLVSRLTWDMRRNRVRVPYRFLEKNQPEGESSPDNEP